MWSPLAHDVERELRRRRPHAVAGASSTPRAPAACAVGERLGAGWQSALDLADRHRRARPGSRATACRAGHAAGRRSRRRRQRGRAGPETAPRAARPAGSRCRRSRSADGFAVGIERLEGVGDDADEIVGHRDRGKFVRLRTWLRLAPLVLPRSALRVRGHAPPSQPRQYGAPLWMRVLLHAALDRCKLLLLCVRQGEARGLPDAAPGAADLAASLTAQVRMRHVWPDLDRRRHGFADAGGRRYSLGEAHPRGFRPQPARAAGFSSSRGATPRSLESFTARIRPEAPLRALRRPPHCRKICSHSRRAQRGAPVMRSGARTELPFLQCRLSCKGQKRSFSSTRALCQSIRHVSVAKTPRRNLYRFGRFVAGR